MNNYQSPWYSFSNTEYYYRTKTVKIAYPSSNRTTSYWNQTVNFCIWPQKLCFSYGKNCRIVSHYRTILPAVDILRHVAGWTQRNFMVVRVQFATTKLQYTLRISFLIFMLLTLARLCKRLTCRGETLLNSRSSACILVVARYNFTVANLHHLHLINDPYFLVARSCL